MKTLKGVKHNALLCAVINMSLDACTVYGGYGTMLKNDKALLNLSCTTLGSKKLYRFAFVLSVGIVRNILMQDILVVGQKLAFQNACLSTAMQ
jgi:hypothetical protein